MKRIKLIASFILLTILISAVSVCVSAKPVEYKKASKQYQGGKYYQNLTSVELTGDMRVDLVAVAISQVYYYEGNGLFDLPGLNPGSGNFTEYNYEYGKLDQEGNGTLTYGYPWCASFITFCLKRAEIPKSICPQHVNCSSWLEIFEKGSDNYSFKAVGSYTPIMGDIVFFKNSATSTRPSDHVGIVLAADEKNVFTIEGNASGGVVFRTYEMTNSKLVGFAVPKYESSVTDSKPSGKYAVNASSSLNMRSEPSTKGAIITVLPHAAEIKISEQSNGWAKTSYDGKTGWVSLSYITPAEFMPVHIKIANGEEITRLDVWKGSKFSVELPSAIYGEFVGFKKSDSDGSELIDCEITDGRAVMTFEKDESLIPVFKEITDDGNSPSSEDNTAGKESGCGSTVSGTLPIILLCIFGMALKKK